MHRLNRSQTLNTAGYEISQREHKKEMAFYLPNVLIFLIVHLSFVRPAAVHDHVARPWPEASQTVTTTEL